MLSLRFTLAFAPVLAVVAGSPSPAHACQPDFCLESNRWSSFGVASTTIATDGVLRLQATKNGDFDTIDDALTYVSFEVTDEMGAIVEGGLEYQEEPRVYVWRPLASLAPGASYDVAIMVDNDALAAALDEEWIAEETWCGENFEEALSFDTAISTLPPLSLRLADSSSVHNVAASESLGSVVCCDGAYPHSEFDCTDDGGIYWSEGICSATQGYGTVRAQMSLPEEEIAPHVATNLALRMVQTDGSQVRYGSSNSLELSMEMGEPLCARLEVVDLAHGELWVGPEQCFGDEFVDELGYHEIDPSPGLATCEGQPYTCEHDGAGWDPDDCQPWGDPPGEDESGSGGDSGGDGGRGDGGSGSGGDEDGSASEGGTSPQGDDGINDRGCACRASKSGGGGPASLWLLVVGFAWRGARRARSSVRARY